MSHSTVPSSNGWLTESQASAMAVSNQFGGCRDDCVVKSTWFIVFFLLLPSFLVAVFLLRASLKWFFLSRSKNNLENAFPSITCVPKVIELLKRQSHQVLIVTRKSLGRVQWVRCLPHMCQHLSLNACAKNACEARHSSTPL